LDERGTVFVTQTCKEFIERLGATNVEFRAFPAPKVIIPPREAAREERNHSALVHILNVELWKDAIKKYRTQMKTPAFVIGFAFGAMDQLGFGSVTLVP
jgi:hypothetical protein